MDRKELRGEMKVEHGWLRAKPAAVVAALALLVMGCTLIPVRPITTAVAPRTKARALRPSEIELISEEVREEIRWRVDNGYNTGIIVGVTSSKGSSFFSYGLTSLSDGRPIDEHTVMEIGSVTKVFTALLLAEMVMKGEMSLEDPIDPYLPDDVLPKVPAERQITLGQLADHTSGLPKWPENLAPGSPLEAAAEYGAADLYEYMASQAGSRSAAGTYIYSNTGMGLLGHIMELASGLDFDSLIVDRITDGLRMDSTRVEPTAEMASRMATGHFGGIETPELELQVLKGAGALLSTADDLLLFLAANMGLFESRLLPAMRLTHDLRHPTGMEDTSVALGWHVLHTGGREILWHNGFTRGFHAYVGFVKGGNRGVVVLSNTNFRIEDIGMHVLDTTLSLDARALKSRPEVRVDEETLESYAGRYELDNGAVFSIRLTDGELTAQLGDQPAYPVYAATQTIFYYKAIDATITFLKDEQGKPTALVFHQVGEYTAARVE